MPVRSVSCFETSDRIIYFLLLWLWLYFFFSILADEVCSEEKLIVKLLTTRLNIDHLTSIWTLSEISYLITLRIDKFFSFYMRFMAYKVFWKWRKVTLVLIIMSCCLNLFSNRKSYTLPTLVQGISFTVSYCSHELVHTFKIVHGNYVEQTNTIYH